MQNDRASNHSNRVIQMNIMDFMDTTQLPPYEEEEEDGPKPREPVIYYRFSRLGIGNPYWYIALITAFDEGVDKGIDKVCEIIDECKDMHEVKDTLIKIKSDHSREIAQTRGDQTELIGSHKEYRS